MHSGVEILAGSFDAIYHGVKVDGVRAREREREIFPFDFWSSLDDTRGCGR